MAFDKDDVREEQASWYLKGALLMLLWLVALIYIGSL